MIRKAFVMQLLPGFEVEYERRHDEVWPEMAATLREHGVSDYSIFLHPETLQLFGTLLIEDEARFARFRRRRSVSGGGDPWPTSW